MMDTIKLFDKHITIRELVFAVIFVTCLTPWVTPPVALLLGLAVAFFIGNPFLHLNHKLTHILLQVSVVGLGFGMNATTALKAGGEGFLFTVASIVGTLTVGLFMGRLFKIEKKTALLIAGGTAICGGSAIAALSPVIKAEERQVSVALGVIFILNSVALFLFPVVGHLLHLSQSQFGLWSAIAIHDTSSVAGAAGRYGPEALQIATTVKLTRALWIIPVSLLAALFFRGGEGAEKGIRKVKIPWFIGLFVVAILLNTWMPMPAISHVVVGAAHAGLTLTLFLIGSGLTREALINTGFKPMLQGVLLWVLISGVTLWAIVSLVR